MWPSELLPKNHQNYSPGLPADEYQFLKNRHSIETHFSNSSSSKTSYGHLSTPRKRSSSDMEQIRRASEIRYATHKALGQSFDFTNDSYDMMNSSQTRHDSLTEENLDFPMPDKYQENNQRQRYIDGIQNQNSHTYRGANYSLNDTHKPKSFSSTGESSHVETMLSQAAEYEATYCGYSSLPIPEFRVDRNHKPVRTMEYAMSPLRSKFSWDDSISESDDK